jgi:hypothetical protein
MIAEAAPVRDANPPPQEVGRLLAVFATLFLDNVRNLEDTVSRVTNLITRDGRPDKEMIVTLQSFDRLKQEFEVLGAALARYADLDHAPPLSREQLARLSKDVIDTITLADLRQRVLQRLNSTPSPTITGPSEDEIDVDVVF